MSRCPARPTDGLRRQEKRDTLKGNPMTIIVDIRPEVQAELARQAAAQGRALEAYAASLLEDAVNPLTGPQPAVASAASTQPEPRTGQALIDAFGEIRGLLTDEEIDRMFTRNPSGARPVDFS
jgi:hypothetical protein